MFFDLFNKPYLYRVAGISGRGALDIQWISIYYMYIWYLECTYVLTVEGLCCVLCKAAWGAWWAWQDVVGLLLGLISNTACMYCISCC